MPVVTITNGGLALPETIPEAVWQQVECLLPPASGKGRPYTHDRRQVLRGIVYVLQTGCGWRELPATFPPAKTVYGQYRRWQRTGVWDAMWAVLVRWCASGELPLPSSSSPSTPLGEAQAAHTCDRPPMVVPETVWTQIAEVLPPPSGNGRPYAHDRRLVLEAILYRRRTHCSWRHLPATYPPAKTVYGQFRRWQKSGHWDQIVAMLTEAECIEDLQL